MNRFLVFCLGVCLLSGLHAEKVLVVASVETPDERAEAFFKELPKMVTGEGVQEDRRVALERFRHLANHQDEVYKRYAQTARGRTLLLASDLFVATLAPKLGEGVAVQKVTSTPPESQDVALLRLVVADPVKVGDEQETVRTQVVIVSAEDLKGKVLFSAPITVTETRKGKDSAGFDVAIFQSALNQAADAVAKHFNPSAAVAKASPLYEVGATTWDVKSAQVTTCALMQQPVAPAVPTLLPGLQPSVLYSCKASVAPLDGSLLGVGEVTIAGETFKNNSALLRGALLPALQGAGCRAVLRGAQSDALRSAQARALPDRTLSLRVLSYTESAQVPEASTALPLTVQGRVEVVALLTVAERATGDVLFAQPIKLAIPIVAALDADNPRTTPFPAEMAVTLLSARVAEAVRALP